MKSDRQDNPEGHETAANYHEWMQGASTLPAAAGQYLSMLEGKERREGKISYPKGSERRKILESGEDPSAVLFKRSHPEAFKGASGAAEGNGGDNGVPIARSAAPRPAQPAPAMRPNRFSDRCVSCGGSVGPGEGNRERTDRGWATVHHPRCP